MYIFIFSRKTKWYKDRHTFTQENMLVFNMFFPPGTQPPILNPPRNVHNFS